MDGTSKYVNLLTGPDGNGLPPGTQVGDVLQWNGQDWVPRQLEELGGGLAPPSVYDLSESGEISGAVPAGHKLVSVTLINGSDEELTVSLGLTEGGHELLDEETIAAEGWIDSPVDRVLSFTESSSLWLEFDGERDGCKLIVETKYFYVP